MSDFIGCDDLREWLISTGFRCARDSLARPGNVCNWYAYRGSKLPARECQTNEGKAAQLVVRPFLSEHRAEWEGVEVDVTGEAAGAWFKLTAYSLKAAELRDRLPEIEARLIAAWNALDTGEAP